MSYEKSLASIGAILIGLGLLSYTLWVVFNPPESNKTITFNVTGVMNATNASSLVQIHFECIKYCTRNSGYVTRCYEQCEKLGGCSR